MKKFNQVMTLSVATMLLLNPASVFAMTKNETIYSTLNYNGVIEKTTINTRLSDLEKGSVVDYTKLDDIKNINGREKFSIDSGTLTWKSTGKDIFYQGKVTEDPEEKSKQEEMIRLTRILNSSLRIDNWSLEFTNSTVDYVCHNDLITLH